MALNFNQVYRFLIVLMLATTLPVWAKEQKPTEMRYIARLPDVVQARMPRSGKTLFCGVASNIGPQKQDVLVHFYSVPVQNKIILKKTPEAVNCTIDLFTYDGSRRRKKMRLLNLLHFHNWTKMVAEGNNVNAEVLWLVPATRQTPVINLTLSDGGAFYGLWQHDVLLVFAQGLQHPPVVQTYFSAASSDSSQHAHFNELDAHGMMKVITSYTQHVPDEGSDVTRAELYWNGKGFASRSRKTPEPTPTPF